jgi:GcrA cell cycle regulator
MNVKMTRNAVMGVLFRNNQFGLSRENAPKELKAKKDRKPRMSEADQVRKIKKSKVAGLAADSTVANIMRPKPSLEEISAPETSPDPSTRCTLMELTQSSCRWPIGDPCDKDFFFCGAPSSAVYCTYHARVAFNLTARQMAGHDAR